jgi:curved DNA-binding protein
LSNPLFVRYSKGISGSQQNHYQTLGLDRGCSRTQIRDAYRKLAKRYHPDVRHNSTDGRDRIAALNAAYEVLSDSARRRSYDRELDDASREAAPGRGAKLERNIKQEVRLRIEDFLKGSSVEVQVRDPTNPNSVESYQLKIPAGTAPGARFRLPRSASGGGFVELRLKVLPGFRFKIRGFDLRCDLRISSQRAEHGGIETLPGPAGGLLRVQIPPAVKRGEILRIRNEGMPKARGGRGDLLVRIIYRPQVRVTRTR